MSIAQRVILVVAGLLMLLFAANEAESYIGSHTLATGQFIVAIGLFVLAAKRNKTA